MVSLSSPLPLLTNCTPFCATDPVIGHFIVFYSAHPTPAALLPPRIEAHILSVAGFQSYPKLALSPSSPLYAAVNHLPTERQSSELYRGLAIAVLKYFSDLPKSVKETILRSKSNAAPDGEGQAVAFDEMHAGDLASRLKEVESDTIAPDLMCALPERFVGAIDLDIVVRSSSEVTADFLPDNVARFLDIFGDPTYLAFTKLKRNASRPASTAIRTKSLQDTADALARELEELVYTEENYVAKLVELSEEIAQPFKRRAMAGLPKKSGDSGVLSPKDLDTLFPPCLERIIEANSRFLACIRNANGIEQVARCCLEGFPAFKKPYEEYIRASAEFPHLISKLTKNKETSFSRKVQQTGEQRLRSLIIEPVQRLPRYSLLIDNMISILPPEHPSTEALNDARGIITEICSLQDSETTERTTTVRRLQTIIMSWPPSLQPVGRLVTAIDFLDILPPYNDSSSEASASIMLLFPDCVVIVRRPSSKSLLARGVMAEVDRPGGAVAAFSGSTTRREGGGGGHELMFTGWIDIAEVRLSGSDSETILWATLSSNLKDGWDVRAGGTTVRKMRLLNQYEGRAYKVEEEFAKARLERRTAGKNRGLIGIREAKYEGLSLWSCIWGSQALYAEQKSKGSTVVYLDMGGNAGRSPLVGDVGVDIAFSLEETKGKHLRLECKSWNDYSSTDTVPYEELLSVFTVRMSSLLRLHSSAQHPPLTAALMSANRKLMRSLGISFEGESRFSKLRTPGPVKLLTGLLGTPGSPSKGRVLLERSQSQLVPPKERPTSLYLRGSMILPVNDDADDGEERQRITMASESPLRKLEDAFEAFINAFRIVGSCGVDLRPLHELHKVDSGAVEIFLEQLVSDPSGGRLGRNMGIDVVYAAFSKFLRRDWKEGMGPLISETALQELQQKSETLYPGDFEDFFRIFVLDWTPQNKRAFRTIIVLLKEMQGKVEAEDDKGMLTKVFTELLVGPDVNPLDYMGLVDLLVEDMDKLFSEAPPPPLENGLVKRAKSTTNTPSLRRRLGLSHTPSIREGSKADRPQSVWRTLSKKDKDGTAKSRLERSKSTDYDARTREILKFRPGSSERPSSRDRLAALGGGIPENYPSSFSMPPPPLTRSSVPPTRRQSTILAPPITLVPPEPAPAGGSRRKRRSSLSDLTNHPEYCPIIRPSRPLDDKASLVVEVEEPGQRPSPVSWAQSSLSERSGGDGKPNSPRRSPMQVPPLQARRSFGASTAPLNPGQAHRMKMQELRDEKPALDFNLQREIDMIGAELTSAMGSSSRPSSTSSRTQPFPPIQPLDPGKLRELSARLTTVESRLPQAPAEVERLRGQLLKKEKELEDIDKLLNDCVAENDVMFERFNEELVKMANGFRLGHREAELLEMLQQVRGELGSLKAENMNLRRENVALKTAPPTIVLPPSPQPAPLLPQRPGHHYGMSF